MKKAIGTGALIAIILGVLFISFVVMGPGKIAFKYVNDKFFKGILTPKTEVVPGAVTGSGIQEIQLSEKSAEAKEQVVKATVECWSKFIISKHKNQICFKVNPSPKQDSSISRGDYFDSLAKEGTYGEELAGVGVFNVIDVYWILGSTIQPDDEKLTVIKANDPSLWMCAYDEWVFAMPMGGKIALTTDKSNCD